MSDDGARITITENGPYLVQGALALSEQAILAEGESGSWSWSDGPSYEAGERYALCRCGESKNKPFCDGSHVGMGFDGTESASREPFEHDAELIPGPTMDLLDDRPLCAFARFCDGHGGIWDSMAQTDSEAKREQVAHQAMYCPSGRLVVRDKQAGGRELEPQLDPSIVLIEDPEQNASGPIWVRGGVEIVSADGFVHERRNRVTLCRCGQSKNKPFCDGTHAHVGFRAREDSPAPAA